MRVASIMILWGVLLTLLSKSDGVPTVEEYMLLRTATQMVRVR